MAYEESYEFATGRTTVVVGRGLLDEVGRRCREMLGPARGLLVTDGNVERDYAARAQESMSSAGLSTVVVAVAPGDGSKSLAEVERLYDALAAQGVGRDGFVLAVGGGMVTDLAGFAAGTWARGVTSVYCPTTLEADVDAAIGGKTGINHRSGKNLIGVFHHPRLVLTDTDCLATLSDRDLRAGLAESIKHAVIEGEASFAWHEEVADELPARAPDTLIELIRRNVATKARIVLRDEREESGERELLNFGHTVGHAVEAVAGYRLRHGECVSLGMVAAVRISHWSGLCDEDLVRRLTDCLVRHGLPVCLSEPLDEEAILAALRHDKKARGGTVRFVLAEALGRLVVRPVESEDLLRRAIRSLLPTGR